MGERIQRELQRIASRRTDQDVLNAGQELLQSPVALVRARRDAYVAGFQLLNAMGRAEAAVGLESLSGLYTLHPSELPSIQVGDWTGLSLWRIGKRARAQSSPAIVATMAPSRPPPDKKKMPKLNAKAAFQRTVLSVGLSPR